VGSQGPWLWTRVLVIDDQQYVRAAMVVALRANGFDVVAFESGRLGLNALDNSAFDLAIVDIYMPDYGWREAHQGVARTLAEFAHHRHIGVLFRTSGRNVLAVLPTAHGLSGITCLQKPFSAQRTRGSDSKSDRRGRLHLAATMIVVRLEMSRILIIDDDAAVRSATKIALEVNGFRRGRRRGRKIRASAPSRSNSSTLSSSICSCQAWTVLATRPPFRKISPHMPIITASGFMFRRDLPGNAELPRPWRRKPALPAALYKPFRRRSFCRQFNVRLG